MNGRRELEDRLLEVLEPVVAIDGYELVDVRLTSDRGRTVLQVFIDHERGVTLEDTTRVTHLVDPVLDVEDPIETSYDLEVSSPGLDRPLRTPEHFRRYAGETVRIRTFEPIDNRRNFHGVLLGCEEETVRLDVDGDEWRVPIAAIERANIKYSFDPPKGRAGKVGPGKAGKGRAAKGKAAKGHAGRGTAQSTRPHGPAPNRTAHGTEK
ncbi:MAG: ribosome maturation factor RimP [Deltaproteobacteria bacterium]|nr:MAG: ribosome maturation factor RimP [Deltaproteobacteria bacterium]